MSSLNNLLAGSSQQDSGTGVTESGAVVIGSTTSGEPTEIKTSTGSTVVTVTDDGGFQLSESQVVRQIVNAINTGDEDNDMKLPTVQAVMTFLAGAVTATIDFKELTSKAAFDTFIATGGFIPTIAFVTDTTPFDYTDNTGHTGTDLTWMFVVCVEENGVITTSMINNSDISSLTGDEISNIIAATEDVNFVNDSDLSRIRNLPDNTADALGGKVNTEAGKGLSQNNFTDAQRSKVDNCPVNTSTAISEKLDKQSTGVNVRVTNTGTGSGSYELENTNADLDERLWRIKAKTDGSAVVEALDDGGNVTETFEFDQSGAFKAKTIKQNNYSVVATNDPMYVLLSALFNTNVLSQDVVVHSESGSALTFKVVDNSDETGFAWQNTGASYTMSVRRESVGSFTSDLVVSMGLDNDLDQLTEVMRVRCDEGDSDTRLSLMVNALHADGDITSNGNVMINSKNLGVQRDVVTYKSSHPNISAITLAAYFAAEAEVEFLGTSSGSINMPVISTDPASDEVQAGTEISFCNFNSGSSADTTLVAPDSDHVFMVGNVGNVFTGSTIIQNASQVRIKARDYRSYSGIGKMCYVVVSA
ncbi:hypothetical protein NVP1236O_16 [Vibrio phage 1.236.O._10N.261.52.C4]|nr:hypothetical protein NVP1198A_28 [Vibrio phage 1.198.A._10N.286.54.F4]AUR94816.1 hypothetical protein NVP1198B_28 [Vibrio phage 1.198.B._10N.286.54.F4]AUR97008.1 hypothetical protein NVP1236O_16 [Vibrio phage 1.236.O._10N.261.52.C4]